jgi:serine protease
VSGQIRATGNTLVDSDVNDPLAAYASNDSVATAQVLPNPATLAGYVNVAGSGSTGRSRTAGDVVDFFRIDATQGQAVSLVIGDPAQGDLDLYLLDENENEIASSTGTGRIESVPVAASGRYYVAVHAYSGNGNYVLSLGQPTAASADASAGGALQSTAEFVPGEVVVRWRQQPASALGLGSQKGSSTAMAAHALSKLAGAADGDWLLKLDSPATQLALARGKPVALRQTAQAAGPLSQGQLKIATLSAIKRLRADPRVEYAEPNYIRRAKLVPNDEFYRFQWHYPLINLPAAWDITTGSNNVIVAVIDTGVLQGHPDLQGKLLPGYDFITNPASARDGNGPDNNPEDEGDAETPGGGSSFHGTHVAGTVAAASNDGRGVAGVAWGARIMPLRVLGVGGGTSFDITQAVLYAARLTNSSGTLPAQRADIINLSLGGGGSSQAEQNVYNQARAAGVIIVAAAGNEATATPSYPASYNGVVSVSAVTINRTLASYSNFGATVDIAAPGGDAGDVNGDGYVDRVLSTSADDTSGQVQYNYQFLNGTSMAAPHVAGVFALMKSVNPALTPDNIDTLLAAGRLTVDIGAPGRDNSFGHGLIDALKAVQAAQNAGGTAPAVLVSSASAFNFTPGSSSDSFTVANGGGGTLSVTSVQLTPAGSWLSVTPPAGASGLGTYTVNVNRTGLAPGAYSGSIRLVSAANTVTIPVVLQVSTGGTSVSSNLGQHYILLVNADTLETVYQVTAQPTNGVYSFQFTNVAAGNYRLFAGSDPNNDDGLCDVGEACGAWVSLDSPALLTINGNRSGLDFFTGYVTAIGATAQGLARPGPVQVIKRLR